MNKCNISSQYRGVFIVITPLHYFEAKAIVEYEKLTNVAFVANNKLSDLFEEDDKVYFFNYGSRNDSFFTRLDNLTKIVINFKKIETEKLYLTSDQDGNIALLYSKIKHKDVIYYEEGGTALYLTRKQPLKELIRAIMFKFIGFNANGRFLSHSNIKEGYFFDTEIIKKMRPHINTFSMSDIVSKYSGGESNKYKIEHRFLNPDIVYLSQPMTKDGYCKSDFELKLLKQFCEAEGTERVLIKVHPRDNANRFVELVNDNRYILLPEKYNVIPYQILHQIISPRAICSHFSSVLYTTNSNTKGFRKIALLKGFENDDVTRYKNYISETYRDIEIL